MLRVKYIALFFCLIASITGCSEVRYTDLDYAVERYAKHDEAITYRTDCKEKFDKSFPKSYRVSCLEFSLAGGLENSRGAHDQRGFLPYLNTPSINQTMRWRRAGTSNLADSLIFDDDIVRRLFVYEKPSRTKKCNRRVYVTLDELAWSARVSGAGTRIYFIDALKLYCGKARSLNFEKIYG